MKQETGIFEASTALKADQLSNCILKSIPSNSVLGISFGVEDDPKIKIRICLITLYSKNFSGIYRLDKLGSMPDSLKCILECSTIIKLGIGCADFARYLQEDYAVEFSGYLDIRHLTSKTLDLAKTLPLTKLILGIQDNPEAGNQLTNIQMYQASKVILNLKIRKGPDKWRESASYFFNLFLFFRMPSTVSRSSKEFAPRWPSQIHQSGKF